MAPNTKRKKVKPSRDEPVSKPPALAIWKMMVQRCRNPRYAGNKNYGVPISERWLGAEGFANFLADVGPQPVPGVGLHRRDPGIGFEPGNVEWGPTRGTILTHDGRSMSQAAWARELAIKPSTLRGRSRNGWTVEKIFKGPYHFPYGMPTQIDRTKINESESASQ